VKKKKKRGSSRRVRIGEEGESDPWRGCLLTLPLREIKRRGRRDKRSTPIRPNVRKKPPHSSPLPWAG